MLKYLISALLFFISLDASEIPALKPLDESANWLQRLSPRTPRFLAELLRSDNISSTDQENLLSDLLETEYLARPGVEGPANAQRLLRGLIQYTLLERHKKTNNSSANSPLNCPPETTIYCKIYSDYHFYFPHYVISQPGNTIAEKVENALLKLDQDFTTSNICIRTIPDSDRFKPIFIRLIYILDNLSNLYRHVIQILSDLHNTSLSEEISKIFKDKLSTEQK